MADMRSPLRVAAAGLVVVAVFVTMAGTGSADPMTVHFTLVPDPADPVNFGPSTGTFTYDSSVIPASGGMVIDDSGRLASEISFEWGSTSWTEANAGVIVLDFDRSGGLRHFRMGGAPNGLNAVHFIPEIVDDFWLTSPYISYTLLGQAEQEWFIGQVTSPIWRRSRSQGRCCWSWSAVSRTSSGEAQSRPRLASQASGSPPCR